MKKRMITWVLSIVLFGFAGVSVAKVVGVLPNSGSSYSGQGTPYTNPKIAIKLDAPINPDNIKVIFWEDLSVSGMIYLNPPRRYWPVNFSYRGEVSELGYWYNYNYPQATTVSFYSETCYSLFVEPKDMLTPGAQYYVNVSNEEFSYTWTFKTSADIVMSKDYQVVGQADMNFSSPGFPKPVGAVGPDGIPWYVWQERDGVHVLKEGSPEVLLNFMQYSDIKGPDIAVDQVTGEAYVVGMTNFPLQYYSLFNEGSMLNIAYYLSKLNADGTYNKGTVWFYTVPTYIYTYSDHYGMQLSMFGMNVDAYGGKVVAVHQIPYCQGGGGNRYLGACHNYIIGKVFDSNLNMLFQLGDQSEVSRTDIWGTPFRENVINDSPYSGGGYSNGCGTSGSAYDCPYHTRVSMSALGILVTWMEYDGNLPSVRLDDIGFRIFGPNGESYTGEMQANTNVGSTSGYDQWAAVPAINNNGVSAIVYLDRVRSDMGYKDGADIIVVLFDLGGRRMTQEIRVNQTRLNDQINPSVDWIDDENLLVTWMSVCQDCGGQGQYARIYKFKNGVLAPVGDEFRWNDLNYVKLNTEELISRHHHYPEMLTDVTFSLWSEAGSIGCNGVGSCVLTYSLRDIANETKNISDYKNVASYGKSSEVRAVHLCTKGVDANSNGMPDCVETNYVNECAIDNGGCGDPTYKKCINDPVRPPKCVVIRDCSINNGGCGDPARVGCENIGNGSVLCRDVDECADNPCGSPSLWRCFNNFDAPPTCVCNAAGTGYILNWSSSGTYGWKASEYRNWSENRLPVNGDGILVGWSNGSYAIDWDLNVRPSGLFITNQFTGTLEVNVSLVINGDVKIEGGVLVVRDNMTINPPCAQ